MLQPPINGLEVYCVGFARFVNSLIEVEDG